MDSTVLDAEKLEFGTLTRLNGTPHWHLYSASEITSLIERAKTVIAAQEEKDKAQDKDKTQ